MWKSGCMQPGVPHWPTSFAKQKEVAAVLVGAVISNNAVVVLMFPLVVRVCEGAGVPMRAATMALTMAASASFSSGGFQLSSRSGHVHAPPQEVLTGEIILDLSHAMTRQRLRRWLAEENRASQVLACLESAPPNFRQALTAVLERLLCGDEAEDEHSHRLVTAAASSALAAIACWDAAALQATPRPAVAAAAAAAAAATDPVAAMEAEVEAEAAVMLAEAAHFLLQQFL